MILKIEKLWLHEKQIIYMEKGSYHTLKSITLELGVLEIRHLRCDGFFAVHVCGVVVINTSESGQQSKKNLNYWNYIFYWNLITVEEYQLLF